MGNRTIHLTKEAEDHLEQIIKSNPDFSFSGFVQSKLIEGNEHDNPENLALLISNKEADIIKEQNAVALMKIKLQKIEAEMEERKRDAQEMQERAVKKREEKIKSIMDCCMEYQTVDVTLAREIATDFVDNHLGEAIYPFMDKKGYILKDDE